MNGLPYLRAGPGRRRRSSGSLVFLLILAFGSGAGPPPSESPPEKPPDGENKSVQNEDSEGGFADVMRYQQAYQQAYRDACGKVGEFLYYAILIFVLVLLVVIYALIRTSRGIPKAKPFDPEKERKKPKPGAGGGDYYSNYL